MNVYHLQIINGDKTYETEVKANILAWSDAGLYEFAQTETGTRVVVAYYPVSKTVIHKIDYNVK